MNKLNYAIASLVWIGCIYLFLNGKISIDTTLIVSIIYFLGSSKIN